LVNPFGTDFIGYWDRFPFLLCLSVLDHGFSCSRINYVSSFSDHAKTGNFIIICSQLSLAQADLKFDHSVFGNH